VLTFSLQSGSNGNSIYVEAGDVRLLFDAGLSAKRSSERLALHGREIQDIDALLISHDHSDHSRCMGVLQRRFNLPVYLTRRTFDAIAGQVGELQPSCLHFFEAGESLQFGDMRVHTLPTPHDAADGVVFVIEHRATRLGILTDLGHPFGALRSLLPTLHAAYIESNYDPEMLRNGPYPWHLQERIRGNGGHLSNDECAELLDGVIEKWAWAALSHLSQENNHPECALSTHHRRHGTRSRLHVASRHQAGPLMEV
jgi:phosphoribosyl 1,2-cyclic phosphodiesterase